MYYICFLSCCLQCASCAWFHLKEQFTLSGIQVSCTLFLVPRSLLLSHHSRHTGNVNLCITSNYLWFHLILCSQRGQSAKRNANKVQFVHNIKQCGKNVVAFCCLTCCEVGYESLIKPVMIFGLQYGQKALLSQCFVTKLIPLWRYKEIKDIIYRTLLIVLAIQLSNKQKHIEGTKHCNLQWVDLVLYVEDFLTLH